MYKSKNPKNKSMRWRCEFGWHQYSTRGYNRDAAKRAQGHKDDEPKPEKQEPEA